MVLYPLSSRFTAPQELIHPPRMGMLLKVLNSEQNATLPLGTVSRKIEHY